MTRNRALIAATLIDSLGLNKSDGGVRRNNIRIGLITMAFTLDGTTSGSLFKYLDLCLSIRP